jgi:hypothetical protein
MVDQQAAPEQNEDEQEKISPALEAFNRKASIGVFQFLYEDYPTWIVYGEDKKIAPFCRIVIGDDDDGTILLDKSVLITGILHLIGNLTHTTYNNIKLASELPGFVMPVPGGAPHVLEAVTYIERGLREIRELVEKNEIFEPLDGPLGGGGSDK